MILNENVVNYKVLEIIEIYNFHFGHLFMWLGLNNSNFEFKKIRTSNKILKQQMISAAKVIDNKVTLSYENFHYKYIFTGCFLKATANRNHVFLLAVNLRKQPAKINLHWRFMI